MTKVIFLLISILIMPINIAFSDADLGYKHYLNGEYDKALKIWSKEVHQGKREAIYNVGLLYFFGKGVKKDLKVAYEYCEKAAYMGSSRAQNNLAFMLIEGLGTSKNYVASYAWAQIAIENGYNSQKIRESASMHLTPAMRHDAYKLVKNLKREIIYD